MTQPRPDNGETAINLSIPSPGQPLNYADGESYKYRSLLEANGIAITPDALIAALGHPVSAFGAAAAHVLGDLNSHEAITALTQALSASDDLLEVEAAYALARMGESSGKDKLVTCLERQLDAYVSPPIAAGYLAQLGDPQGFSVVARAFEIETARLLACKQLFFFAPFQEKTLVNGETVDIFPLFARALRDGDVYMQSQALAQLHDLRPAAARQMLADYIVDEAPNDVLRQSAEAILAALPT
ncbi:MAG TPA: HEAT repeat domain-containing protein [Ktedonobacterales bacterium]|jgi:HEAT repeat protein